MLGAYAASTRPQAGASHDLARTLRNALALPPRVTFRSFVDDVPDREHALVVLNRTQARPVLELLEATFPEHSVPVRELSIPDDEGDIVALVREGEVLATSPLSAVAEQLLFVNSDLFTTGTRPLEDVDLPEVLVGLDDVRLQLRGYPESDREKLVLIAVSRLIERRAVAAERGTLRTSFQRLSRVDDERGTRFVYERLQETDVDVHVYGVADELPEPDVRDVVHASRDDDLRRSWFVVYTPPGWEDAASDSSGNWSEPDGRDRDDVALGPAALLAVETSPRTWTGFWTFDPDRVRSLNRYVERSY